MKLFLMVAHARSAGASDNGAPPAGRRTFGEVVRGVGREVVRRGRNVIQAARGGTVSTPVGRNRGN